MIIGIDASRANRDFKTGTEWYSYYLIKNLAEIDAKNKYWLYTDKPLTGGLAELVQTHKNFQERLLKWPFDYFWTLGRLTLEMLKFWRRPRVLFVPAHSLPLIHPRRTITTIHDIAFTKEVEVYENTDLDYLNWSTKYALKHARRILTVSNYSKTEIMNTYKVRPEKIAVVHNGYNDAIYKKINDPQKTKEALEKYGITQPFILVVGRLEKKKNIPMLIEAFAILKEKHPEITDKLVLVGQAGFGYDEITYIIEEYDLNSQVLMIGWVEESDLAYIHNAARTFVFPSRHEGFGIPVIQALACGLPAAVSDLPVLREVAGDAALYFNKDNKHDMAAKLYQILTDETLRQNLSASGLERAKQFSWKKCATETLAELQNL